MWADGKEEYPSLVSAKWLHDYVQDNMEILGEAKLRILDGSWHPPATGRKGFEEWQSGHIPGALYFDVDKCVDSSYPPGSFMLPPPEQFEEYVGKLGIDNNTHVVVYDNNSALGMISAPRVWWMFRAYGHNRVSVLDGGLPNWMQVSENLSTSTVPVIQPQVFKTHFRQDLVMRFDDMVLRVREREKKPFQLLDGRPAGMFDATAPEPKAGPKHGHVPGARNIPFNAVMDGTTKRVKDKESMEKLFDGVDLGKPITVMCLGGVTSCCLVFALHLLGAESVRLYDGSWEEWFRRAKQDMMVLKK